MRNFFTKELLLKEPKNIIRIRSAVIGRCRFQFNQPTEKGTLGKTSIRKSVPFRIKARLYYQNAKQKQCSQLF